MKIKIISSALVALIVYLLTVLIKLIRFEPLYIILISSLRYALIGAVLTFIIIYTMELLGEESRGKSKKTKQNKNNNNKKSTDKARRSYSQNDKAAKNQEKKESQQLDKNEFDEHKEKDFNEIEPPIIEYEK